MSITGELDVLLDSVGGFAAIDEFGIVATENATEAWRFESGALSIEKAFLPEAWRQRNSIVTLLLSGDSYTAWNSRKRKMSDVQAELDFNKVVLKKHAKAASAWSHRKWCIERCGRVPSGELSLCELLAERYPRNYFAWTHRLWLLRFERENLDLVTPFLAKHVTDYSAAHFALALAANPSDLEVLRTLCKKLQEIYPHLLRNGGALATFQRSIQNKLLAIGHDN